ncbi:Glycerol-3-phosphate dehydrogenase OS=Rhodanobacter lindaniclasticus OX=75310 GN=B1991_15540 PE=3 SV=1 [Rhodanobacter lindaniclasticus]
MGRYSLQEALAQLHTDMLVVGGGINGAGIASDAAGRGLSVVLCERDDLAAHTSSASTKLIHGGLRYLEQYEFRLVAKALAEREVILRLAPHISWPLLFVLPHESHLRPAWMIRLGLLLYDSLGAGHRTLADSRAVDLHDHASGAALKEVYARGFVYSDGWVQRRASGRAQCDGRFAAWRRYPGAHALHRCACRRWCMACGTARSRWIGVHRAEQGAGQCLRGPWAGHFLGEVLKREHHPRLRLVKGSHIVVARLFDHDYAYIFQLPDRRIVFAIPYATDYTLIGTTDVDFRADPATVTIEADETRYLCEAVNRYLRKSVQPRTCCGVTVACVPCLMRVAAPVRSVGIIASSWIPHRARRCSTCLAARSPPTGALPRTPWIG